MGIEKCCAFSGHRPKKFPWGYDETDGRCITLKALLKLHCILPYEEQAGKWTASAQERYYSILTQADSVIYTGREYGKDCMLKRNRYLVDHTACLLAVYNGGQRGGTAMTVRYAKGLGRKTVILLFENGIYVSREES